MFVADLEGSLERDLGFSNPTETDDGCPLAVLWFYTWRNPQEKLFQNCFAADEMLISPKRNSK